MTDPNRSLTDGISRIAFFPYMLVDRVRPKAVKFLCVWLAMPFVLALMLVLFPAFVVFAIWETLDD